MNYYIQIFGCQMNKSDAERIASLLQSIGYKPVLSKEEADLIVIVSCSVRHSAENRVYGLMRQVKKLKAQSPKLRVVLTGCMALHKEAVKKLKNVDIFLDIKDLKNLPKLLNTKSEHHDIETYFSIKPKYQSSFTAYVPIMTGCNNFCAYCIVPYVRGREESRAPKQIIDEVKDLIKKGYKEIVLLGQNVNSYNPKSLADPSTKLRMTASSIKDFPDLLEALAKLPGDFWLRFVTSHPKDFSDKLLGVIANNKKVTEYIHLPVQAGDDQILEKMNRGYTALYYKKIIKKVRQSIPEATISTDIIVGFPGETKEQFNNTAKLLADVKFDMVYINKYSPRSGTAAAKLKDDVSTDEKDRREEILNNILKKTAVVNSQKLVGQKIKVLVDKKKGDYWFSKTRGFKVVRFKSDKDLLGKFVTIKVAEAGSFGLIGDLAG